MDFDDEDLSVERRSGRSSREEKKAEALPMRAHWWARHVAVGFALLSSKQVSQRAHSARSHSFLR